MENENLRLTVIFTIFGVLGLLGFCIGMILLWTLFNLSSTPMPTATVTETATQPATRRAGAEICMNKIIHVADSAQQARDDLREPIRWFFRTQADLIADADGVPPEQYAFYRRVRENLLSLSEDKALDHAAICGDPEEVADKLREHREVLGVEYVMGAFNRGGVPSDRILRSMRLFGEKVIPRLA